MAWWRFEDSAGTVVDDISGKYDLVLYGADLINSTETGKVGRGLVFDGTSKNHANHPRLLGTMPSGLTFAGWVRPDATGMDSIQTFLSKTNNNTNDQMFAQFQMSGPGTPGEIKFVYRNFGPGLSILSSGITWTDDTWYHYAVSWGSEGVKLYIDGNLTASNADSKLFANGEAQDFVLGNAGSSAQYFKGMVDEVQIYGRSLNAQEIQGLYNSTNVLHVVNGMGDGLYSVGEVVSITADAAAVGKVFDKWTGADVSDIGSPSTIVTISTATTTITATYKNDPAAEPKLGDIDNNGSVDLVDAILVLRVLSGNDSLSTIYLTADVNNDQQLGMEEVLYILNRVVNAEP